MKWKVKSVKKIKAFEIHGKNIENLFFYCVCVKLRAQFSLNDIVYNTYCRERMNEWLHSTKKIFFKTNKSKIFISINHMNSTLYYFSFSDISTTTTSTWYWHSSECQMAEEGSHCGWRKWKRQWNQSTHSPMGFVCWWWSNYLCSWSVESPYCGMEMGCDKWPSACWWKWSRKRGSSVV